jgi:hypothetical protein
MIDFFPLSDSEHRAEIQLNREPMPHPKVEVLRTRHQSTTFKASSAVEPRFFAGVPASAFLIGIREILLGRIGAEEWSAGEIRDKEGIGICFVCLVLLPTS